ncbi:MAG: thiamine phosphate synthase [Rhodocyclaceae bacterium]
MLRGLYLITPDTTDTPALMARLLPALAGRPALLQYRNKCLQGARRRTQAEAVLDAARAAAVPVLINDDPELAAALGADGAHVGRDDAGIAQARARLGGAAMLGASCYDRLDLAIDAVRAGADHVAFGSVFASPTKPAAARAPLSLFGEARRRLPVPLVAIGGITLDNAREVVAAGADLLAVISDVFDAPDPLARVIAYRALFELPG